MIGVRLDDQNSFRLLVRSTAAGLAASASLTVDNSDGPFDFWSESLRDRRLSASTWVVLTRLIGFDLTSLEDA